MVAVASRFALNGTTSLSSLRIWVRILVKVGRTYLDHTVQEADKLVKFIDAVRNQ
jgi:hypothetical protein